RLCGAVQSAGSRGYAALDQLESQAWRGNAGSRLKFHTRKLSLSISAIGESSPPFSSREQPVLISFHSICLLRGVGRPHQQDHQPAVGLLRPQPTTEDR